MILHTINKSAFDKNSLDACLRSAKEGCAILFIEDGVYSAMDNTSASAKVKEAMGKFKIFALTPDLVARGVEGRVIDGIEQVDYAGFVNLAAEYTCVQSWL